MVTAHARQRAYERLSFLEPEVVSELLETIKRQRPGRMPRWADPRRWHEYAADGVVRVRVWEPCPRKPDWYRERTVGFPAVNRNGSGYELTTCVLGPLTGRERLSPELGSRIK